MDPSLAIKLKEFAHQLNQFDVNVYEKLISRVFERFIEKCANTPGNSTFNSELEDGDDLDGFDSLLSFSGDAIAFKPLVTFLFRLIVSISKAIIKPKVLYKELVDANLTKDRAELFVTIWRNNSSVIVNSLKSKSFGKFSSLVDVDWMLKLLTEQSNHSTQSVPIGELNLELNKNEFSRNHSLTLGFTHSELIQFYDNLENIQTKLDQLQK